MDQSTRRDFLQTGTALWLAFAAGALKPADVFGADWNGSVLDAKTTAEVVWALGGEVAVNSNDVSLSGPEMVGSGFVVPLSMDSKIPGTDLMVVVVQKNPIPFTCAFNIPPDTQSTISTRIKMGETSTIYGIARANGKCYVGSTMIKVRAGGGGCG